MFLLALATLAGVLSLNLFTGLPGNITYCALVLLATLCWMKRRSAGAVVLQMITVFVFGLGWAQYHAASYLAHVLPEALAGEDLIITARIAGIPVTDASVQRFIVDIEKFADAHDHERLPQRLKLSWYYGEPVSAGETWQFMVRLKPPHGFMNPGGFDYEAWLLQNAIHATGYVRSAEVNRRLKPAAFHDGASIRQHIAARIASVLPEPALTGLITALAVGDRSAIDQAQWRVLINTGTNHLMAISGLHIGLAAAFGYWLCRRLLPAALMHRIPAQHAAMLCAITFAWIYAMLAGFAIPTQRALLMLICAVTALLLRRKSRSWDVLAFALIVVLLWDPAAVMSAGFWFSFIAVAVIFYALVGLHERPRWFKWLWMQLVIALALFPLSLFMFQQTSLVAPVANLLLVPYVSLLVVPLVLLGVLTLPLSEQASTALFVVADFLFRTIWPLLQWLADLPYSHWTRSQPAMLWMLLALAGVAVLLAPRLRHWRFSGMILLLPAVLSRPQTPPHGAYELNVLDVGQGLSVVVRTHAHTLVYDTGARFSDRLDSGQAVLLPFLIYKGVDRLDRLMISHGDGDHIGGARSLLQAFPQTPVLGRGIESLPAKNLEVCSAGQQWIWDGVRFTVLHPDDETYLTSNNRSCVLKIDGQGGSVLLAGDIEKKVENRLLSGHRDALAADILVAPHHGSNTSSSQGFIETVAPNIVIFAAAYRNRYKFPAAEVVARYAVAGSTMYMTGHSGAISINVHPLQGPGTVRSYREISRKYWHHLPAKLRQAG